MGRLLSDRPRIGGMGRLFSFRSFRSVRNWRSYTSRISPFDFS
jgi:hypothetical protein